MTVERARAAPGQVRLFRLAMRIYSRRFREAFGVEMERDFVELLARHGPGWGRLRTWGIVLADLPRSAWTERRQARRPARKDVMTNVFRDIRVGLRGWRRAPGFTALVIGTLALGIGGAVAMFSVLDGVLLSDLSYRDADRIAIIWNRHPVTNADKVQVSGPDFVDYRTRTSSFSDFAFIHNATDNSLTDGQRAEQVDVGFVSANFFAFLGVDAVAGRTFAVDEAEAAATAMAGAGPVVISYDLWVRRYGADPAAIGRTIALSGTPVTIIGVVPADFQLVLPYTPGGAMSSGANDEMDVWRVLPDRAFPNMPRNVAVVRVLARLAPGVTFDDARREFDRLALELRSEHQVHADRGTAIDIVPLRGEIVGHVRATLVLLMAGVGVVLLIASANVANLVMVQATRRRREVDVRRALGAPRARLLRQWVIEYGLLSAAGAVCGIAVAAGFIRVVIRLAPASLPLVDHVGLDLRALGLAVALTGFATLAAGVWPAVAATGAARQAGSRAGIGRGARARGLLVTAEVALSLVLLVLGGLLARGFVDMQRAALGAAPADVMTARVSLGDGKYQDESLRRQYWDALERELAAHPGIARAGLVSPLPFAGQGAEVPYDSAAGAGGWGRLVALTAGARPGYFEAIGATRLDGRTFEPADLDRADRVVVIDDLAANRLFGSAPAVGRSIRVGRGDAAPVEIVGVVRHVRHSQLTGEEREVIYRPAPAPRNMAIVLDPVAPGGGPALAPELTRITGALDVDVPLFDARPLASYIDDRVAPTRFAMTLVGVFGLVALVLAMVALYGVISYAVSERTSEIGLRMALGADAAGIVRLVLRQGVALSGVGIGIGLALALVVAQATRGVLVEVPAPDLVTLAGSGALLAVSALVASWLPARRAARLDPAITLKDRTY